MDTKRFNELLREVGGHEVPDGVEEKRKKKRRKVEVEENGETREVVLCEGGVTAVYDEASGLAYVTVPLAEEDDDDRRKRKFNELMDMFGLKRV